MKRALITGVAGGIGEATANLLEDKGWEVSGVDIVAKPKSAISHYRRCDLAETIKSQKVIAELAGDRLDLLVNAAAIQPEGTVLTSSVEDWDRAFSVNVRGAFLAVRAAHAALEAAGGVVVNIGSIHSRATSAGRIAYVASKGAVAAFTRACALELAPAGIRVNSLLPGAVDTSMLVSGLAATQSELESLARKTPLGRIASPQEIASAVLFFASEAASFMTGQELVIDGGAIASLSTE